MKKQLARLVLGIFLFVFCISLFPHPNVVSAQTADQIEADKNRRYLFHLIACLQRDNTFDDSDDLTGADDIFDQADSGYHVQRSVEVVGLDLSGSGTMTCLEAMQKGLSVLRPGAVNSASIESMGNYFIKEAFGRNFASSSESIDMDKDALSLAITKIVVEATAEMAKYTAQTAGAADLLLRNRVIKIVDLCFDKVGYNQGTGSSGLAFEVPGVGFFYGGKTRSEVIGTTGNMVSFINLGGQAGLVGVGERASYVGDVEIGYDILAENADDEWPLDQRFFPVGLDNSATANYSQGLIDCNFVEQNAGIIFNGIRVGEDGEYENSDGTPLSGPLADAVIPVAGSGGLEGTDNCESAADFAFSFILCPILALTDTAIGWLDDQIIEALNVSGEYYGNEDVKKAWGNIRNISFILLLPVVLIMVIGTALQFSFVDPYTVKRALPRIFVAIIFIALSFDITSIMIGITNGVGKGVAGIITQPFGGINTMTLQSIFAPNGTTNALFTGGVLAGVGIAFMSGVTIWTLFSFVGMAALALLIIFLLLSIRELIIIFLVVISPIAIITWIFPGNDKGWKLWWSTFSKMLLLYPLIMAFLGMGRAFATLVNETSQVEEDNAVVTTIVKLVAFIGPYFFIPKAFQMAGGALANLAGMVNDRGKGIFDRQRKFRADQMKHARERNKTGNRFRNAPEGSLRSRMNKSAQNVSQYKDAGFVPSRVRAQKRLHAMHELESVQKDVGAMSVLANDDASNALMSGRGTKEDMIKYLMSTAANGGAGYGRDDATQIANELQLLSRTHGLESMKQAAFIQLAGSKTAYRGGPAEMLNAAYEAAGGDTQVAASLYAKARGAAEQAGRVDLAGYSYGEGLGEAQKIWNARAQGMDEASVSQLANGVNTRLLNKVVDSKGAGALITSHGTSAKNVTAIMNDRLQRATADFETARSNRDEAGMTEAYERQMSTLAEIANAYDAAAYASPENAREFRDNVLKQTVSYTDHINSTVPVTRRVQETQADGSVIEKVVPVMETVIDKNGKPKIQQKVQQVAREVQKTVSVQELMESARSNETFRQTRREHSMTDEEMRRRGPSGGIPGAMMGS